MSEIPVIALRPNEVSAALTEIEPEPSPAVQVRELGVRFGSKLVLSGVGMDFPTGRITALIGPSGCGKTTLLRSLNRMHDTTPGAVVLGTVLLGDIDIGGVRGRQGINLLLASALTEWRIRLRQIARSPAWKTLEAAHAEHRSVPAMVQARVPKGLALSIYGLNGLLPIGQVTGIRRSTSAETVDAILRQRLAGR